MSETTGDKATAADKSGVVERQGAASAGAPGAGDGAGPIVLPPAPVVSAPAPVVLQAAAGEKVKVGFVGELGEFAARLVAREHALRAKLSTIRAHIAHGLNGDVRHTAHGLRLLVDMIDDDLNTPKENSPRQR
jgi:hypothetical protein